MNKIKEVVVKQQRKIHIKPSYIILGVILILLAAFCIRVAVWEHNYFARMEGSERASSGLTARM